MQKSLCVDLFAHKRVRNLGQVERYRMRDVHPPLISKEEWREAKNRISMPDREAVILEELLEREFSPHYIRYYSRRTLMYECLHV